MLRVKFSVAVVCCLLALPGQAAIKGLQLREFTIDYSPFTLVAQPGEELRLSLQQDTGSGLHLSNSEGQLGGPVGAHWVFNAPTEPGHYSLDARTGNGAATHLNLFVTIPAGQVVEEKLNGYRLGAPPPVHEKLPQLYAPPAGYIEVNAELLDIQLTPHFQMRQFLCKQKSGYPKYLVIKESLLVLLEGLLQAVHDEGYPIETFGVISAYRTPWYNRQIGNVANSRHVYGDAMDLFVDLDQDGKLDDLNADGDQDHEDVTILFDIATRFMAHPDNTALVGGVGRYRRTSRHGGFVHVDTRGYPARW